MFKSINEYDKFSYDDCVLSNISNAEDGILLETEALIVKANNSQNSNFTESYAGPSVIKFENGKINRIRKAGFKYYNADNVLIKEVPDEEISKPLWGSLIKSFSGNYLPSIEKTDEGYLFEVEMSEEDGTQGNSYLIEVSCKDFIVTFEKYLNRVQK